MRGVTLTVVIVLSFYAAYVRGATVPQEPEEDNQEYLLDLVTNQYNRSWREVWDAGDNRFRFRLGSNNVTQWFLEEELKFSTELLDRLRFRFYHSRRFRYTTDKVTWDVMELEARVHKRNYASLYVRPTFDKRQSSLGFMYQHRRAVNRFILLSVEWPGLFRNFFEHHRNTADSLLNIFTDRPVRLGLDVREQIIPNVWIRARGEFIPSFEMGEEVTATGERFPKERAEAKALAGWAEYIIDPARDIRDQMVFGIEMGYQRSRKSKDPEYGGSWLDDIGVLGSPRGDDHLVRIPQRRFGEDLYERTEEDTVMAWRDSRRFVSPYAWVPLNDRVVLRGTLRFEEREIAIGNDNDQTFTTINKYVVPSVGVRYGLGDRRQYLLEAGFASEFRERTEKRVESPDVPQIVGEEDFDDHRLYIAFEYVFGDSKIIRFIEAFELDSEDRGEFKIHDHGFCQLILGF